MITREYPPEVYGGAGVHVAELVAALRADVEVQVRCFGAPRDEPGVHAYGVPAELAGSNPALTTLGADLLIASDVAGADLVHSHTWYANAAGHLATDEVGLLQHAGHPVWIVEGDARNTKLTRPSDWKLAEALWPDWAASEE